MTDTKPEIIKLTLEHADKVEQYIFEEFMPDEPTMGSFSDLFDGNGIIQGWMRKMVRKDMIEKAINSGISFGTFDAEGNLLGIKLGKILYPDKTEK